MKKTITTISILLLIFLGGCSQDNDHSTNAKKNVVVVTLMTHPALDQVIASMKEELRSQGFTEGKNITFDLKNANGEMNLIPAIVQNVKTSRPDVVVAITTPVAQAFAKDISAPLVFSAVTDPVGAGVVKDMTSATENVSGVSDAWPYRQQMELITKMVPAGKRLGVVYNPGEAASQYGIKKIRIIAKDIGLELVEMVATKTTEVYVTINQSINKVDVIYLSSDNTVIQALPAAMKVCLVHKKPLFVGDSGTVEKGGLAAISVGYTGVGRETGKIVAKFLQGQNKVIPVTVKGDQVYINLKTAELIGLEVPQEIIDGATQVYE